MTNMLKNKKFIGAAVTAAAVASVMAPVSANVNFTDVNERYVDAVGFLVANDITAGLTETTFGTEKSIKRVDAAVLIANALGLDPEADYRQAGFKDVPSRAVWAVNALAELEILNGYNSEQFGSSDTLTRAQAAAIIARAADLEVNDDVTSTQFEDVNNRFAKYVEALVENEIAVGKTATHFGANANVTRGEMALFLDRAKEHFGFFPLTVMHTNDTHANVEKAPQRATAIEEVRADSKNNLLLDAGDVFSGTLYFNEFQGQADLELMNYMGYDAMTFGNHEFDLGSSEEGHQGLVDFIQGAEFPFVSANVNFSGDALFEGLQNDTYTADYMNGEIYDGIIANVNGEDVGIFGLTTAETESISSPGEITFTDYLEAAEEAVAAFEEQGVDKIIAITHIGFNDSAEFDNDLELAEQVEGIDIIVGGHTHVNPETTVSTAFDAPTLIVQAGEYSNLLGTLDVVFNESGEVTYFDGEKIDVTQFEADPEAASILAPYKTEIDALMEQPIGATAVELLSAARELVRSQEAPLGNVIADGMLAAAQEISSEPVAFAVQNGGGIRADIDAGEITFGEVMTVLPFNNSLAIMELTGTEIKQAFEHSVSQVPELSGGFLQVSEGVRVTFDSSQPANSRVVSVELLQESGEYAPIEDSATYRVATNVFTAKGGDGYDVFAEAYADGRVSEPGNIDWETFVNHLVELGEVNPQVEGRIVDQNTADGE